MFSAGLTGHPELTSTVASLGPYLSVGAVHLMAEGTRRCGDHQGLWWKQNIANPLWLEDSQWDVPLAFGLPIYSSQSQV